MGNEAVNGGGEVGFLAEMLEQVAAKRGECRRIWQFKFGDPSLFFNRFLAKVFYFFKKNGVFGGRNVEVEGGLGKEKGGGEKEKGR